MTTDPHNLKRFLDAQEPVFKQVQAELRAGHKRTHWMWFIFPQMKGLGHSDLASYYGIATRREAEAYLAHPVLGPRLRECTQLVNHVEGRTIEQILGYPDNLKFRSSMTLFAAASGDQLFNQVLAKYFEGQPDPLTLQLLGS